MGKKSKGKKAGAKSRAVDTPQLTPLRDLLTREPTEEELIQINQLDVLPPECLSRALNAMGSLTEEELMKDENMKVLKNAIRTERIKRIILDENYIPSMASILQISEEEALERTQRRDGFIIGNFRHIVLEWIPWFCNNYGVLETHYAKLFKKGDPKTIKSARNFIRCRTTEGRVDHQRHLAFGEGHGRFCHLIHALDDRLKDFFDDNKVTSCPAVDLASGTAVYAFEFSRHFGYALEWYPTEREECLNETRDGLNFMKEDIETLKQNLLFADPSGVAVHVNDIVELEGLSKEEFNGLKGRVEGYDSKNPGRFAVVLDGRTKAISFKRSNIVNENKKAGSINYEEELTTHQTKSALIDSLLERACEVDIQKPETWENVDNLKGRCAVVTCTSLLTCVGYREPYIWKESLELASVLLAPGGFLLQYDTEKWGGFGKKKTMAKYIEENSLGLVLEERNEPVRHQDEDGRMFILLWRKGEPL